MTQTQQHMRQIFKAEYVSLHVRKSNQAAFHLYNETLKYEVNDVEKGYYADKEDAYDMRCVFEENLSEEGKKEVSEVSSDRSDHFPEPSDRTLKLCLKL